MDTEARGCISAWASMKRRSIVRTEKGEVCEVHPPWMEFTPFKKWAESNGYDDTKQLCRDGDTGNYCPSNARWDTLENNVVEAKAKYYLVKLPCGQRVVVYNMRQFCIKNGLQNSCMTQLSKGQRKQHKKHKCELILLIF